MVAKKDAHMPRHPGLADENVPNVHVMKAMLSFKSRGYVKEQFAWRHFYCNLKNEGIQYLRDYLHLPPEIVPTILRRSHPRLAGLGPKVQTVSGLQDSQEGRQTETPKEGGLCPLELTRKLRLGLAQQPNSSLEFRGGFGRGRGQPPQ